MIICVCRRISHHDVDREVANGCNNFDELQSELGVATQCGCCAEHARNYLVQACERNACCMGARHDAVAAHRATVSAALSN